MEIKDFIFTGIADEAGDDIDTQIKAHKELGWNYIELRNVNGKNITEVEDEIFEEICEKLDKAGLKVSCFSSQIANWARPINTDFKVDLDELEKAIPRMKILGVNFIRIMSYPNRKDVPLPEEIWKKKVIERLTVLTKMAEQADIILAHEICAGYGGESPQKALTLIKAINSENFVILFDTGNPPLHGQDSYEFYAPLRNYVKYIHIKDSKLVNGEEVYTYPGEGEGRVKEVLRDAYQNNYKGFVSIEPHLAKVIHANQGTKDKEKAYRIYIEYGQRLMKLIQEL